MVSFASDKFDRVDGDIGTNWTVPCGNVTIFDESVYPVSADEATSGLSPVLEGTTERRTQVLWTGTELDGPDQVVRAVWSHVPEIIGEIDISQLITRATTDPSFTVVARMSKDPLLVDLGGDEEPFCYNQGYGLRVTFPRSGANPILKIVKFTPTKLPPGIGAPSSSEVDGAIVLTSGTLSEANLHVDENGNYRGEVQDMRMRIRRADNEVIVEAYLNDRNLNTPILSYTDRQNPLWGEKGLPGFEFLSAVSATQPSGSSPFSLQGIPLLVCHLWSVETIKDFRRPAVVAPRNVFTYSKVTERVITLVEKNGDAKYNATVNGQTKLDTYLNFVLECEADIIRTEGYWHWLYRESRVYLEFDRQDYEMPEDVGLIEIVRPGNWNNVPLREVTPMEFRNRLAGVQRTGGRPTIFTVTEESVNNRKRLRVFPVPTQSAPINTVTLQGQTNPEDAFLVIEYFARRLHPSEPDVQLPYVPQENIDVLIYGATAHALLLDTDPQNAQAFAAVYNNKRMALRRENNRKASTRQTVMRSAADVFKPDFQFRIPLLRSTQLETLLI